MINNQFSVSSHSDRILEWLVLAGQRDRYIYRQFYTRAEILIFAIHYRHVWSQHDQIVKSTVLETPIQRLGRKT